MATWKAENSMLTQRGVEILNKLKAGIGSINVTRVVIGSGRVSKSKLYNQTSISGVVKEVDISAFNTTEGGSEIVFYVSNSDFTSPYEVHQIGIFVTHPDYNGEQLYHISQCEESDFDTIPSVHDTAVTQGYSIYLEHGNSSAVTINVSPQGLVGKEEFETFKISLNKVNKNLLDNWYLIDPIDSKQGFVVPNGIPYYTAMNNSIPSSGSTTFYTAVTPVDKQWCRLTIDGSIYYCSLEYAVRGYEEMTNSINNCIDRFCIENVCTLLTEDGLRLIAPNKTVEGNGAVLYQPTTSEGHAYAVAEFPITVSVLLADGRFAYTTVTDPHDGVTGKIDDDLIFGIAYVDEYQSWQIFRCEVTPNHSVTIKAVKTEIGAEQTLAHQDHNGNWVLNELPNYSTEVAKCNQYGSLLYVKSDAEITSVLSRYLDSMSEFETKSFNMKVESTGLGIDEGTWFIEINRASINYATVLARRYDLSGILLRACSYDSGVFTNWSSITSSAVPLMNVVYDATVE